MADLIFALVIIAAVLIGRHTGFLKGLINLVCVVIASFGGYLIYPYFSSFLVKTPLFNVILNSVSKYILKNYYSGTPIENLNEMFMKYNVSTIEDLFAKMSEGVTLVIINIISIVIVFVVLRLILNIVKGITSLITKIPVIKGLDKTLGMILSIASSLLVMYLLVAVMMIPPCNTTEISKKMCEHIDNSVITKHVMDYNIFINYDSLAEMGIMGET